ncbi:RNA methyltransferase [Halobacteriales archaeon SW_7_68_16]|nr:MAG: RNA methyltransferase [Halobacteriales archaeon SW_7_68_16]
MPARRDLARRLAAVADFDDPDPEREQYATPPDLAAHLVHRAGLRGDLARPVVDLGTGTGRLAIAAAIAGAPTVLGIEVDADAITIARENERAVLDDAAAPGHVYWLRGDVTVAPVPDRDAWATPPTVIANPPFGAQAGNRHADRAFLDTAGRIGAVSWTIHNAGSRAFVTSFAEDTGGTVTAAYASEIGLDRVFEFHDADTRTIEVELYRIEW